MKVRVFGTPAPQGSTRSFTRYRKDGSSYTNTVGDNAKTKPWRQSIIDAVHDLNGTAVQYGRGTAVRVDVIFLMPRPGGHYGKGRNAAQLRPGAPKRPTGKPDRDKLLRALSDALKDAGVYADDAQVTDGRTVKDYAGPDEAPGAIIEVTEDA